jgi:hypothetical protein
LTIIFVRKTIELLCPSFTFLCHDVSSIKSPITIPVINSEVLSADSCFEDFVTVFFLGGGGELTSSFGGLFGGPLLLMIASHQW